MLKKAMHLIKGKDAEQTAAAYLKKQGIKILSRNTSYKTGELDIVAEGKEGIIFVEVKYRSNLSYGTAAEMVSPGKQERLRKTALLWMQEHDPQMRKACRFDVIAISEKTNDSIEWIKNAF